MTRSIIDIKMHTEHSFRSALRSSNGHIELEQHMKKSILSSGLIAGIVLMANPVQADEGMWTFDAFPAAKMKAKHGFAPDQAWLNRDNNPPSA